jgi:hypothetical protein
VTLLFAVALAGFLRRFSTSAYGALALDCWCQGGYLLLVHGDVVSPAAARCFRGICHHGLQLFFFKSRTAIVSCPHVELCLLEGAAVVN